MINQSEFFWDDTEFPKTNNATLRQVLDFGRNVSPGTDISPGDTVYTTKLPEGLGLFDLFFTVAVGSMAFGGLASVTFYLDASLDNSDWEEGIIITPAIARADLGAGEVVVNTRLPNDERLRNKRYLRARAVGSGTATNGRLRAALTAGGVGVTGILESQVERHRGYTSALPKWRTVANPDAIPNN